MESRYLVGLLLWIFRITTLQASSYLNQPQEFCEFDKLTASCHHDEVVVMDEAHYGRMSLGRCVQADLGFVGCYSDVLDIADQLCSGRRQCQISVPNKQMKAKVKCLISDLISYLTASFSCHKALSIDQALCRKCDFVRVSEPSGIIANVVTQESKCGSAECPWLITVPKGQRINMTLVNFGWGEAGEAAVHHRGLVSEYNCRTVLATLKESGKQPKTICKSGERVSHIYTSSSNSLEVRIVGKIREDKPLYFLLKYQAVGCTDPEPPVGGWIQRKYDTVTAGCNESSDTTQWLCTGSQWEGKTMECSKELLSAPAGYVKVGGVSLSVGLSVAVIVVLAFFIGLIILSVGLIIAKRRRARRHAEDPIYQPPPYLAPNYREPPPYYDKTANQGKQSGPCEENGYTHIWQRPLPDKPEEMSTTTNTMSQQDATYVQEPGSVHYGYNSIASVPKSGKQQLINTKIKSRDTSFAMATVKDTTSKNPANQDCRYFQLDPERMSNHVSA